MLSNSDISQLINALRVHQIRAGTKHKFVDISIVESQGRFFVRQYKFGDNSWRQAFDRTPEGEIKCGKTVIKIIGRVPDDLAVINDSVTKAFKKKYGIVYSIMKWTFNTEKHEASTLELVPQR